MPYGMGQIRYNNSPTSYAISKGYANVDKEQQDNAIWEGEYFKKNNTIQSYKDYRIRMKDGVIDSSKVYLLHFEANRNSTYDMMFDLKLCTSQNNGNDGISTILTDYQNIRRFTIRRDVNEVATLISVILFDRFDDFDTTDPKEGYTDVKILDTTTFENGIVVKADGKIDESYSKADENKVYLGEQYDNDGKVIDSGYFYYGTTNKWTRITDSNVSVISKSWLQKSSDEAPKASFDFIIKNSMLNSNVNKVNTIVVEMVRQPWDADIENEDDGSIGLVLEGINWKIYELQNLLSDRDRTSIIPQSSVSTIGVWGHPNQILTINGEEIRIGQSGYYELTDFDINNLCIAALGPKDRFTLDYQYKLADG